MKFKSKSLCRLLGKTKLGLKKHGPTMLVAGGVGAMVAGTVVAVVKTKDALPVIDEATENLGYIRDLKFGSDNEILINEEGTTKVEISNAEYVRELISIYAGTAWKLTKVYAIPLICEAAGIAAVFGGHGMLKTRCATLAGSYAALTKAYEQYRKNVIDDQGEEADKRYLYGEKKLQITTEDKKGKTKTEEIAIIDGDAVFPSIYAKYFDQSSRCWEKDPEYNLMFLKQTEEYFNQRLDTWGHVFLNEVYDALDIPRTSAGQHVGWKKDNGDGYISFGIHNATRANRNFVNGLEPVILLDFNVDGDIIEDI